MPTRTPSNPERRKVSRTRTHARRVADSQPSDPTSDEALLALPARYTSPPDIPVVTAQRELGSLARLATACASDLAKVGISSEVIERAARFARVLAKKEKAWQRARGGVTMSAVDQKRLVAAEALDAKLVAGGRWALRHDHAAQATLSRIAEGSGLVDTLQDLRDLQDFWREHAGQLGQTLITAKDLARIPVLIQQLEPAAQKEADDVAAARAMDLRNRAFWAAHELAREIREAGRYVFAGEPKLAARFVSRYRAAVVRRSRKKTSRRRSTSAVPTTEARTTE